MITPEQQRKSVLKYLEKMQETEFWGKLILRFREGNLVLIEPQPTITLEKFCSDYLEE